MNKQKMNRPNDWRTCTFSGIGGKKQAYHDSLVKKMTEKGFQQVEKIEIRTTSSRVTNKSSDLMFKSPDGLLWIGIRSLSIGEDLKVGYTTEYYNPKRTSLMFAASMLVGAFFSFLSIFIIGQGEIPLPPDTPTRTIFIPVLIFFAVFLGTFFPIFTRPFLALKQQLTATLIETAEAMGSKQIMPFHWTTADLEKSHMSRLAKAGIIISLAILVAVLVTFILVILYL